MNIKIEIRKNLKDRFYVGERLIIKKANKVVYDITWWYNAISEENEYIRSDIKVDSEIYRDITADI
jgi:hypothetical protein